MECVCDVDAEYARFNSTKVRLRHRHRETTTEPHKFQFHKGSIKTTTLQADGLQKTCFNSTKVRLRLEHGRLLSSHEHVSIPQRFD